MSNASVIMGRAKAALVLEQAFFASIICSMEMIEDATMPMKTMATNGKWVRYDPGFVEKMSFDEVKFVLCHEVGHCIFQHMFRRGSRDHRRWNQAGDYVINDMLINANVGKMPAGGLHNPALVAAGKGTTDGVYDLLPADGSGGGGQGNGKGDPLDDCQDQEGTPAEQAEAQAAMKVKVCQAAQAAKMCGQLTADMERLVNGALKAKVDWKDVLRRFVSTKAKVDRTYSRPQRRFMSQGLYLPSLTGEQMGQITFCVDVSGSISEEEVSQAFSEMQAVKADVNPEAIHVIYFHSQVERYDRFEQDDELVPAKVRTGGTAFGPCFRFMDKENIEPVCCVFLTDLHCSDFGPEPDYPVLWITTGAVDAPWGDVVPMHDNQ